MRRYETDLDPDARYLPPKPPPEWTSDTLKIFWRRVNAPVNIVLETALIAVQERLYGGDLAGAEALLDDIEAALDAGGELDPARAGRPAGDPRPVGGPGPGRAPRRRRRLPRQPRPDLRPLAGR